MPARKRPEELRSHRWYGIGDRKTFGAFSRGHSGGLDFELQFYPDNSRGAYCFSPANAISSLLSRSESAATRGGPGMQVTRFKRKGFVFAALAALALPDRKSVV